ncbi:MAG: Flp pilus assembly protein CpaB [Sandaracinaceae bacterium]|nr:Flp pilus assembly protein CpaB [Sandaracinaceae bacterium]
MKSKALLVAIAAAVVGLVLVVFYMQSFEAEASGGDPTIILVARQNIPLGAQLDPATMLAERVIPAAYVENRHVRAAEVDRIRGIRVVSGVRAGEALLWTDLATMSDSARDLSSLVRSGMRAITIQANQTETFGGLLRPGDRVDVLLTLDRPTPNSPEPERVTVPLLQSLIVLAAGQDTGMIQRASQQQQPGRAQPMQNVTLSATVEQAQMIAFASQRGRLALVLRNPDDIPVTEGLGETTTEDLVTIERRERIQHTRPHTQAPAAPTGPVRIQ